MILYDLVDPLFYASFLGFTPSQAAMRSTIRLPFIFPLILCIAFAGSAFQKSESKDQSQENSERASQSSQENLEDAYRANNVGVALLEQYNAKEAAAAFRRALNINPKLFIARHNLSLALYYAPDLDGAFSEAQKAAAQNPSAPQPNYLMGLITRAQNRFAEAISNFEKVRNVDADDVGTNVNLGQLYAVQKRYPEAITSFRKAIDAEPYNETALYNLGILLTRTGARQEGQQLLERFQRYRQSGAGTTMGNNYLEQGRYAEALVSTGVEPELVDQTPPHVAFTDATQAFFPAQRQSAPKEQHNPQISQITQNLRREGRGSAWGPVEESSTNAFALQFRSGATLFDYDGDGSLDLLALRDNGLALLKNDHAKFLDVTATTGALTEQVRAAPVLAVAGDYDNDGLADLLVVRYANISIYHNDGQGRFSNRTREAGIPAYPYLSISAAFADVDHDGDLDVFVAGFADLSNAKFEPLPGKVSIQKPESLSSPFEQANRLPLAPNLLLRNNGNGTFSDVTTQARVATRSGHAVAVVPTDFNNRRDVDLFVANYASAPDLFSNQRDGSFRNVAKDVGFVSGDKWSCVAAGDINKDGFTDFFLGKNLYAGGNEPPEVTRVEAGSIIAISDRGSKFTFKTAPVASLNVVAAQFVDYDNDGLIDCLVVTDRGLQVLRNIGSGWINLTQNVAGETSVAKSGNRTFASGDLDGDGDVDLIIGGTDGELRALRNDGGNRNVSVRVNLKGRVSNKSAVQSKIEMRAGSLWQKLETYAASPAPAPADLIFGLGKRVRPDAVRVIWSAGIVQAETDFGAATATNRFNLSITELDRKPSSCPYLYTWNGSRFEFITDFLGGGEMGYLEEVGRYNRPDPLEYVRIPEDKLKEKDGRFDLRITNELEEALFVDRLQLWAISHPAGTELYPNEGMTDPPKPFRLFVTQDAQPPLSAVDEHGHDVLDRIAELDRRYPDDFKLDRIRGYAEEHTLTMKLDDQRSFNSSHKNTLLLLTGWTDYAWSSDNLAAGQAGKTMMLPSLQTKDQHGQWRTVIEDIGIPVGRPQTVTVDLTGKFLSASREVRIVTNMRIYWDQILVDRSGGDFPVEITKLDPANAQLRWRGFSREFSADGRQPFGYDYERVSFTSPWKVMTGRYTREGDVRELLLQTDDMFIVSRPGDQISISFDATRLPALPPGWMRTFVLYADGFSKEMDINSASPDQVGPLPFHGMSRYPYAWPEAYPLTEKRRAYIESYNTRVVTNSYLSLTW